MARSRALPQRRDGRLRASPNFALTLAMDGRPFVAKDSEPYIQYWLSERERDLWSLFARRGGRTTTDAIAAYLRLTGATDSTGLRRRLVRAVDGMRDAGVLIAAEDDTSRYSATIAESYLTHRPFPPEIASRIVADGGLGAGRRALDLAGGPGDLALQLAQSGAAVTLMELSRGFLDVAGARAAAAGRALDLVHDSANRLVFRDDRFDVVTVAQALHWLDDVQVCRGLCRVLEPGGSFFVVHGIMQVPDAHPLAYLLGDNSILGPRAPRPFAAEVEALRRRLALLFDALDTPDVDRIDLVRRAAGEAPIRTRRVTLYRQVRPLGIGFARAFLTPAHIAVTGQSPDAFWAEAEARIAAAPAAARLGECHWALLQFGRTDQDAPPQGAPEALGYGGPAEG